jgi:hypothetical protein
MGAPGKTKPARRQPAGFTKQHSSRNDIRSREHVAKLRLTARCLSLQPVFVSDAPVCAELFDKCGRHVETWSWS